jgi:hypothetical protein
MVKFKYKVVSTTVLDLVETLNLYGEKGWEHYFSDKANDNAKNIRLFFKKTYKSYENENS